MFSEEKNRMGEVIEIFSESECEEIVFMDEIELEREAEDGGNFHCCASCGQDVEEYVEEEQEYEEDNWDGRRDMEEKNEMEGSEDDESEWNEGMYGETEEREDSYVEGGEHLHEDIHIYSYDENFHMIACPRFTFELRVNFGGRIYVLNSINTPNLEPLIFFMMGQL